MTNLAVASPSSALHWHRDRDGWFAWTLPERADGSHQIGPWYEITPTHPHEVYYHPWRKPGSPGRRPILLGASASLDDAKGYALTDDLNRQTSPFAAPSLRWRKHATRAIWYADVPSAKPLPEDFYEIERSGGKFNLTFVPATGVRRENVLGSHASLDLAKAKAQRYENNRVRKNPPRANPLTNDELNVAVALGGAAVVGIVGGLAWYLATRPKKPASASNGGAAAARAVTPAGATWKQLSPTDTAGGGHTYLMSIAPIPDHTFASLQGELTGSSMTLLGVWDQGTVPPGWPSNDGDPNRWRIEFHVADEVHPQAVADLVGDLPSPALFQLQS